MIEDTAPARKRLLLVEPHSLFRSTLANVARQFARVDVHETSSLDAARLALETQCFDALMLNVGDKLGGLDLLQLLRDGGTLNPTDLPTALLAESIDQASIDRIKAMAPKRLLLMPFKVRTALDVITELMAPPGTAQPESTLLRA